MTNSDNEQPSEQQPGDESEQENTVPDTERPDSPNDDDELSEEDFLEIRKELEDNSNTDSMTVLLAIVQAAVTDTGFNAGTVQYMLGVFGMGELWDKATELYQDSRTALGEDEDEEDELEDDQESDDEH